MSKIKKVVAYCRVSTGNQKEEGTIELQVVAIREYCKKKNYILVKVFKDDGISGGLENRPALSELFTYLEQDGVQAVVIWKLDRLARDLYIQEYSIKRFEKLNVSLISTKEPDLDSSDPMRKAFRQFMGVVAELEKAFITMRLSSGRINKAKNGEYAGGGVALGYSTKNKELTKVKQELETIKKIFNLKRYGKKSINEIARILNNERVKTKKGGKWHASTVAYILKNPVYRGIYKYKGISSKRGDLALK